MKLPYQDAQLLAFHIKGSDLKLEIRLSAQSPHGAAPVTLTYFDVKNLEDVKAKLAALKPLNDGRLDDLSGILPTANHGFLLGLSNAGDVIVYARGALET